MVLYNEVFTVNLDQLVFLTDSAGELLNPRGAIFNSTKMQKSLASVGQEKPITVVEEKDANGVRTGRYIVQDGATRVTAARILGWQTIKACFPIGYYGDTPAPAEMVLHMLVHNTHKDVVPSRKGKSFAYVVSAGVVTVEQLASSLGESVQFVQDCIALQQADSRILKAVDRGDMSLTAFREFLQKRPELQADVASKTDDLKLLTVRGLRARNKEMRKEAGLSTKVSRIEDIAAVNADNELIASFRALVMRLAAADLTEQDKNELKLSLITLGEICE